MNLKSPKVLAAKHEFERPKQGKKNGLNFEDLFTKFANPELSFRDIAKKVKRTPQNIHQIFHQYFKPILPKKLREPHGRRKAHTRAKHLRKIEVLIKSDQNSAATHLYEKAVTKRIPCERVYDNGDLKQRYVKIHGQLCYTLICRKPRYYSQNTVCRHYHFPVSAKVLEKTKFVILIAQFGNRTDYYIFKTADLKVKTGNIRHFYVPDVTTPPIIKPRQTPNKILFEEHRNAWHILKNPN